MYKLVLTEAGKKLVEEALAESEDIGYSVKAALEEIMKEVFCEPCDEDISILYSTKGKPSDLKTLSLFSGYHFDFMWEG